MSPLGFHPAAWRPGLTAHFYPLCRSVRKSARMSAGFQAGGGGDVYTLRAGPLVVGLFAGETPLADKLALAVAPEHTPLAPCSSSGRRVTRRASAIATWPPRPPPMPA